MPCSGCKDILDKFQKMLEDNNKGILATISGNFQISNDKFDKLNKDLKKSMESINDKITFIERDLEQLKEDLNVGDQLREDRLNRLEEKVKSGVDSDELKKVREKMREIEDRSRRNNIRIEGLKENERESWEDTERKVQEVFVNNLGLNNIKIERAHRVGRRDGNGERPRTVVLKLLDFKDKEKVLSKRKKLTNTNIFINEDFCKETVEIRKSLMPKVKELREQGKYAIISYDKIVSRERFTNKQ